MRWNLSPLLPTKLCAWKTKLPDQAVYGGLVQSGEQGNSRFGASEREHGKPCRSQKNPCAVERPRMPVCKRKVGCGTRDMKLIMNRVPSSRRRVISMEGG